jgi:hypothetical protein
MLCSLVITQKSPRLSESGLLDESVLRILRCAQDDSQEVCHPERSEGSLVDLQIITNMFSRRKKTSSIKSTGHFARYLRAI